MCIFSSMICCAQHIVEGKVTCPSGPVEYAVVIVLSSDSVMIGSSSTDSIGYYRIPDINVSTGKILCRATGFSAESKTFDLGNKEQHKVDFSLKESGIQLGEVEVEGTSVFRNEKGYITALPNKAQKTHSFGGFDLLANMMIPGVTVDKASGRVSALFGSASLYINGIQASVQEIRSIRAKDVVRVEYYDVPAGQYAGENAVVNFIVKSYGAGGFGEITAQQKVGFLDGKYDFVGKVEHKSTAIQLFGGYGLRELDADKKSGHVDYGFPQGMVTEQLTGLSGRSRKEIGYAQLDITNSNRRRVIRGALFFNYDDASLRNNKEQLNYSASDKVTDLLRTTDNNDHSLQGGGRIFARFNMAKQQAMEANARLSYARNKNFYRLEDSRATAETAEISNRSLEHRWDLDASVSYTKNFSRGNSLAVKLTDLYKNSSADYFASEVTTSTLWSNEGLLFVQYVHPLSKKVRLSVQPGLSGLFYKQKNHDLINVWSPRLNVRLMAAMPKNQFFMFSADIGNSFPNLASLSTAERTVNEFLVIRGNPDIDNTKLYQGMAVYGLNSAHFGRQVMARYQYMHSIPVSSYTAEANDIIIQSWNTGADTHYFNSNVSLTYRPVQQLNFQLSGGYNRYEYTGYRHAFVNSYEASLNINAYLGHFAVNLNVSTPQQVMGMDLAKVKTPWQSGLSVNYALSAWKFEAGVNNPFGKTANYHFSAYNPAYSYDYDLKARSAGCVGYLKVSYNFDFGKAIKKSDLKAEEVEINNSLLKPGL